MAGELLLDTGALISLRDRSQQRHAAVSAYFRNWKDAVVTSEAVLTEATHLLGRVPGGRSACLDFILRGGATMVPSSRASLERARELIMQYADLPMDYADATLVVLAEELGTNLILTTDRRDFEVYRLHGSRPFKVVPS